MIKRVIEISTRSLHLSVRHAQLCLHEPGEARNEAVRSIPCEDVGVVLIEHPHTTISQAAMAQLAEHGAVVIFCGLDHLPAAMSLPLSRNSEVAARLREQIESGKPIRKRIWAGLIRGKIRAQADNLAHDTVVAKKLRVLAREVRSGDPANVEAHAARLYWRAWLTDAGRENLRRAQKEAFRRDTDGDGVNALLNYGYAVLRAAVARALVAAGLQPALGIHHTNRSNAFALADDLMEPLRPAVDRIVQGLVLQGRMDIEPASKRALLGLLHAGVEFAGQTGPLMVVLHRYTAAFLRCLRGEDKAIEIPRFLHDEVGGDDISTERND